jgi:hypothetical protein
MQSGTGQSVDTINRTGENLARVYGEMPRAIGEGVRGTVESYKKAEKEAYDRKLSEEDRARAKEAFGLDKDVKRLQISTLERGERDAKSEEEWWNQLTMAPGVTSSYTEPWNSPTRRNAKRQSDYDEYLAAPGRNAKQFDLTLEQLREQIRASKANSGASASQAALNKKLLERQIQSEEEQKYLQALEMAAVVDMTAPKQFPGDQGPPRPAGLEVDKVLASLPGGIDPIRKQTLAGLARKNAAQAAQQGSMIGRTVDPAGRVIQDQLLELQGNLGKIANLAGVVSRYSQVPTEKLGSEDAARALSEVRRGLEAAAFSPDQAQQLKQMAEGEGFRPLSGLSDEFRGNESGGFYQTSQEGSVEATKTLLQSYRTQAQNALAQATTYGDANMKNQAQYILAGIDRSLQLIGAGADPASHNRFTPTPQQPPQGTFDRPPQPGQGVQRTPVRFDGRG